jgi:hypothetical protein
MVMHRRPVETLEPFKGQPALNQRELAELRGLVDQAWSLRDGPWLTDAVAAIIDWRLRTEVRRLALVELRHLAIGWIRESYVMREKRAKAA